jgi:hypothetical protein
MTRAELMRHALSQAPRKFYSRNEKGRHPF